MIGLVVTGHGQFAEGMHTSALMIAGENENVKYVNFEDGMSTETLAEKLSAAYNELAACDGIVVLSDLPGGSPFKTAVEVSMNHPDKQIVVLSGTNLPMIITGSTMLSFETDPQALADELLFEGKDNVVRFELTVREEIEEVRQAGTVFRNRGIFLRKRHRGLYRGSDRQYGGNEYFTDSIIARERTPLPLHQK